MKVLHECHFLAHWQGLQVNDQANIRKVQHGKVIDITNKLEIDFSPSLKQVNVILENINPVALPTCYLTK